MDLFEKLFEISDSPISLDYFISESMQEVNDFYNLKYSIVLDSRDSIEKFILFKSNIIEQLDFEKSYNRSFISILLDFCERFNFIAATPKVYSILQTNNINIGHRLQAALLFLYNIDSIPTLISRIDSFCKKIQISIELEEDNDKKAISTFLNYFSIVIRDTQPHTHYALDFKSKIECFILNKTFPFLNNEIIQKALKVNLNDAELAFEQIQIIIDHLLNKSVYVKSVFKLEDDDVFLIEDGTKYSEILKNTTNSFKSIREISVNKILQVTDKHDIYRSLGRGVAILENESQMYSYMNSFGSSHNAKMLSALGLISFDEIDNDLEIFDWSCGQGLATIVFLEYIQSRGINLNIKSVTLIEPSIICLKRSSLHVRHFNKTNKIRTICKEIDLLEKKDVKSDESKIKIHFFSNILDVEDFSISNLIALIENTQKGLNYFVCASPYITDTKTERVDSFNRYFSKFDTFELLGEKTNGGRMEDEYWCCNNKYKNCMCSSHPHACKGSKKWTRVIRVFKIIF